MKAHTLLFFLFFISMIYVSCKRHTTTVGTKNVAKTVIDTTLLFRHLDIAPLDNDSSFLQKEVETIDDVLEILQARFAFLIDNKIIVNDCYTLYANLINDSIWVALILPENENGKLIFGNSFYCEIRKVDGRFLKCILEE